MYARGAGFVALKCTVREGIIVLTGGYLLALLVRHVSVFDLYCLAIL